MQDDKREIPRQRKEQHRTTRVVNGEERSTSPPTKAQRIGKVAGVEPLHAQKVNPKEGSTAEARAVGGLTCMETKGFDVRADLDLSEVIDKKGSSMAKTEQLAVL